MGNSLIQNYINNDNTLNIEKIVNDYSGYIFTIIKNMTKNLVPDEDIEEMISDVLLVLWKNKEKLKYDLELRPYLATVTKNIAKNKLRSLKVPYDSNIENQDEIVAKFDVEEIVSTKEEFEIISKQLKKIGKDSRIFIMFYFEGKKTKQIADELKINEFTIHTKLHRMRKKIKKALEERGYRYGK